VLPRKAAANVATLQEPGGTYSVRLANGGNEVGDFDLFSLLGTSGKIPRNERPQPGDNFAVVDLRAFGVRYLPAAVFGDDYLEFAISTHGRRSHPNYPAGFEVYIDIDGDGVDDFAVFNGEAGSFASTGQNLVNVVNLATGAGGAFFYSDADLNSGSIIMTVPMAAMGLSPGTTIGLSVYAYDNYFTGDYTDAITDKRSSRPAVSATRRPICRSTAPRRRAAARRRCRPPSCRRPSPPRSACW
jgi:hypothetical protein